MTVKIIVTGFLLFLFCVNDTNALETDLFAGTQIPIAYSLGIEQKLPKHFSINLQGGILTFPFDKTILNILKAFGTDKVLTNTIGEAFSYGLTFQATPKFQFGSWYAGPYYSYMALKATDAPADLIENYYGEPLPDRRKTRKREVILTSNLHNIGLLAGRRFTIKNNMEIRTELSLGKSIYSFSQLRNNKDFIFDNLSDVINKELGQYYIDYGYIPSINIFFVYKLVKNS